jgi:predicted amidohydrolase
MPQLTRRELAAAMYLPAMAPAFAALAPNGPSDRPPRKVIVGTMIQDYRGEYPGLEARLADLVRIVDGVAEQSRKQHGRGPDLVVLPEVIVNGQARDPMPFEGRIEAAFAEAARRHRCYIVVSLFLLEKGRKFNAAVLVNRRGEVAGIYRKLHLAVVTGSDSMEEGATPGREVPVFECDFGKLGLQICFDMEFDYGWEELARQGAELVAWPTASPQTARPAARALRGGYYVVSSTPRHNAGVFEPTGRIAAQVKAPEHILVTELDLSYVLLPWSPQLRNGELLAEKYGDKVGFHYYEEEDIGIFWSNDAKTPIGQMIRSAGLPDARSEHDRISKLYHEAGVPSY